MYYPYFTDPGLNRVSQNQFGGLSGRSVMEPGRFAAMENLTGESWPALSTRAPRGRVSTLQEQEVRGCCALHWKDGLLWLDESGSLHAGGHTLENFAQPGDGRPRQLVSMGAYVCVFPDKRWCNAVKLAAGTLTDADHGPMARSFTTTRTVELGMCTAEASTYELKSSLFRPENPVNGDYWLDIGSTPRVLRRWSDAEQLWKPVQTTYVRLYTAGIGANFSVGDTVWLNQLDISTDDTELLAQAAALRERPLTIRARGNDFIVLDGQIDEVCTVAAYANRIIEDILRLTDAYTLAQLRLMTEDELDAIAETLPGRQVYRFGVEQRIPALDHVVECGNRLWGCRYDGQVNEIYASCLGDFANWWRFEGLASDAYRVSRGADGPFTAAAVLGGTVLFFRQQWVEKIFPAADGAHQVVTTALDGVAPGCTQSLQAVDGVLYYLSAAGIMAYDGSLPVCVSRELKPGRCTAAAAGRAGSRYYLSCRTDQGDHLLVYDTVRSFWHREDDCFWRCACAGVDELYFADESGDLFTVGGTVGQPEPVTHWMAETGLLGLESPDHLHAGRLDLRLQLPRGGLLRVWARYDDEPDWTQCACVTGTDRPIMTLPIRLRRCAQLRLRLEGDGPATLFSLTRCFTPSPER